MKNRKAIHRTEQPPLAARLVSLLRAALWQTEADPKLFGCQPVETGMSDSQPAAADTSGSRSVNADASGSKSADWNALYTLAQQQTVAPLVYTAILTLPEALRPDGTWLRTAYPHLLRTRQAHRLLNGTLAEAVAALQAEGIRPVLLKGQAYARHYPDPELRQCGDIDLYIGEEDYARACTLTRRLGWYADPKENLQPNPKHYGCYLNNVCIELHRMAAVLDTPRADRLFRPWSRKQLDASTATLNAAPPEIAAEAPTAASTEIPLPTPLFDVVFVFLHLYHHFLNGGVGLRQLCDWVMLLHAHHGRIDLTELRRCLHRFGLWSAWRKFGPLAVDYLGLPPEEFPFYAPRLRPGAEKILGIILHEGNFGKHAPQRTQRPDGYWRGKMHSFCLHQRRLLTLLPLVPQDATQCYLHFIYKGIRQLFIDRRLTSDDRQTDRRP